MVQFCPELWIKKTSLIWPSKGNLASWSTSSYMNVFTDSSSIVRLSPMPFYGYFDAQNEVPLEFEVTYASE